MTGKTYYGAMVVILCALWGQLSWGQRVWHHAASPFRAVFEVKRAPNHADGGIMLEVPSSDTGRNVGRDIYCYDGDSGRLLPGAAYGQSSQVRSLVLIKPESTTKTIYAYFGSGIRAGSYKMESPMLGEIRSLPKGLLNTVAQGEKLVEESSLLGRLPLDRACMAANYFSEDETYLSVIEGSLQMKRSGSKTLFVASSGPSYLYVDDELVIDAMKNRNLWATLRGENRKTVSLKAGLHRFRLVTFHARRGPRFLSALGVCQMSGKTVQQVGYLSGGDALISGTCVLQRVEGKSKRSSVPQFWYRHLSYMAIEGIGYITETELGTYSKQEATWKFEDGCVLKGAKVIRLFGRLTPQWVEVSVKREKVRGVVAFSMVAPRRRHPGNRRDFDYYAKILSHQGIELMNRGVDLAPLLNLMLYYDQEPMQVPLAEAYLKCRKQRDEVTVEALKCLARTGSQRGSDKGRLKQAAEAYDKLLRFSSGKGEVRRELIGEAIEFAIFCLRDWKMAERWLSVYGSSLSGKVRGLLTMDLLLQRGDRDLARQEYDKLLAGRQLGANVREGAVRGSFLGEEAQRAVESGRLQDAHKILWDWVLEAPIDRVNGSYSLVRARYFRARGWLDGAEGELRGVMGLDKELPNLPEVEFELGKILQERGDGRKARAMFKRVNERYPNHPIAEEAGRLAHP